MKNYSDQLSVLYHDRLGKLTHDDYPDEYKESLDEFTTLCKEIEAALPKDRGRQIMLELDSILGAFASTHQETGYRLGFKDAFRLSVALMETA